MAASIEEITKEAIDLPRHQRLALVRCCSTSISQARVTKSNARGTKKFALASRQSMKVASVDEGRVDGIPYEQIKKEVAGRFPSR
jgi:hypothetical protein